jgi:hypothetical protein
VLDGVKARAVGEHPTGKDALHLAGELHLIDFDEGRSVRRLSGRTRVAGARRHFKRAELHRLIYGDFEMGDAARHLVEGREHGNRILDDLGLGARRSQAHQRQEQEQEEALAHGAAASLTSFLQAACDLKGYCHRCSGALLHGQTPRP